MKRTTIVFFLLCMTLHAQTIIRYENETVAKFEDEEGSYTIGLGADALTKTEAELKVIAQQKFNELKLQQAQPKPPDTKQLLREALLKELGAPEDQLEMIYNDMVNGTTLWRDKRTEIKNRLAPK